MCQNRIGTHIVAAWVSLICVCFETECPVCGWTSGTCFDLLKVDQWLQEPARVDLPKDITMRLSGRITD
jgi:hypothetical protein